MTDVELLQRARAGEVIGDGKRQIELLVELLDSIELVVGMLRFAAVSVGEHASLIEAYAKIGRPEDTR